MEFFDYIKNLFTKGEEITSTSEYPNMWMVNRFISGSPISFEIAQELNLYLSRLPDWAAAMFLYRTIPKTERAPWLVYSKKQVLPYPEELIAKISGCLNCSTISAIQYISLLENSGVDTYQLFGLKRKPNGKKTSKKKNTSKSKRKKKKNE